MSKKLEYDSTLGGPVVLGTHMPTYKYAASALKEMKELLEANKQSNSNKLVFQTLPKHMRRRAMSHHPKRLPRKYRAAHIHQMSKSGKPQATRRPSRKHRRRPQNLLKDYLRRQRKHKWLETHIWHAKRFHMIEKWGYKLPYASCDKTYRACYRATAEHCLLQDISFYACVEMNGSVQELSRGFEKLTSKECGLSLTAKTYLTGRREGYIDLFKANCYPFGALGKVTFLWCFKSDNNKNDDKRCLWLWLHPAAYNTVLEEIIKVFDLKTQKTYKVPLETQVDLEKENDCKMDTQEEEPEKVKSGKIKKKITVKQQRRLQFMTKTSARQSIKHYKNSTGSIELKELKDTLNRFRLTGPLAQSILAKVFKPKILNNDLENNKNWLSDIKNHDTKFLLYHEKQQQFWLKCIESITSPAELLSNMVLSLNIEDPRLHRPQKRLKAVCDVKQTSFMEHSKLLQVIQADLSYSPLWCEEIRNRISSEMLSTHEYCSLRAQHVIVPGKACQFEASMQPVPVILVQRPGSLDSDYKCLGYGCGWDIIAPAGYGMSIWLALIMWGARPGGLREFNSIAREMGTEEHLPDTVAGHHSASDRYTELFNKYFRLPPNKRCNYRKFAIVSPFRIPFSQLIRDWSSTSASNDDKSQEFFVLREHQKLQDLAECVKKCSLFKFPKKMSSQCLIQLKTIMKSRGNPKDFSLICLPSKKDLKRNLKLIKLNNHQPIYMEPLLADPNEKERHQLRVQHKKLLKRLRARRVREKRKKQETSNTRVYIRAAGTANLCLEQFKKMCNLWLPQDFSTLFSIRKQGTRDCFGYASSAGFCLTEGTVGAIAYVTAEGLKQLLKLCQQCHLKQPVCLIRSPNSRNYRFAKIQINLNV